MYNDMIPLNDSTELFLKLTGFTYNTDGNNGVLISKETGLQGVELLIQSRTSIHAVTKQTTRQGV